MNREIKFRGYATGIGWVYGSLINNLWTYSELSEHEKGSQVFEIVTGKYDGDCWSDIAEQEGEAIISVVPQSVGEFTGLKDANRKEIYEGDILKEQDYLFKVQWDNYYAKYYLKSIGHIQYPGWNRGIKMEIIGNIYENPELLKK